MAKLNRPHASSSTFGGTTSSTLIDDDCDDTTFERQVDEHTVSQLGLLHPKGAEHLARATHAVGACSIEVHANLARRQLLGSADGVLESRDGALADIRRVVEVRVANGRRILAAQHDDEHRADNEPYSEQGPTVCHVSEEGEVDERGERDGQVLQRSELRRMSGGIGAGNPELGQGPEAGHGEQEEQRVWRVNEAEVDRSNRGTDRNRRGDQRRGARMGDDRRRRDVAQTVDRDERRGAQETGARPGDRAHVRFREARTGDQHDSD
jgi:hypothetical protein